ncbi:MAG: COX15/CtaA family protein [Pseudomonadota bacterium]
MARGAVFEEVDTTRTEAEAAAARARSKQPKMSGPGQGARAAIAVWLWSLVALVSVMILVGGLTRLTDSGLSITVWDPVMGAIPPLSPADWEAAFDAYKTTTEYQQQNSWMTLDDFKPIFWWEWGHRQLGRLIGLVWAVGFFGFLLTRKIPRGWTLRLFVPGLLGGVQGAVGWWMVSSGLVGRLDVASYRLALHLGLAFAILALLVWLARRIRLPEAEAMQARRRRRGGLGLMRGLALLLGLQILVGALVAGIDAGRSYVDWPLMQGAFLPPEPLALEPLWRNFFENAGTVQFVHRMLGYLVLLVGLWAGWRLWRRPEAAARRHGALLALGMVAQTVLGVVTVMNAAPLEIAIWHQAGAILLTLVLASAFVTLAYPPETRIARAAR